jgi:hypothetical protein
MSNARAELRTQRFSVLGGGLTGASLFGVLFVACWVGTAIQGLDVTHAFISLFTTEPVASQAALMEGLIWAAVFGGFSGALTALFGNVFAVARR